MKKGVQGISRILSMFLITIIMNTIIISTIAMAQANQPNETRKIINISGTTEVEKNFRENEKVFKRYRIFVFLDSTLKKATIISKIVFGIDYQFELRYFLTVFFFLLFLLFTPGIIRYFSGWSIFYSSVLAFFLNVVLSQIVVFKGLSLITIGLISQGSIFSIVLLLFMFLILVAFFVTLYVLAIMVKRRRLSRQKFMEKKDKSISIGGLPPEGDYQRV